MVLNLSGVLGLSLVLKLSRALELRAGRVEPGGHLSTSSASFPSPAIPVSCVLGPPGHSSLLLSECACLLGQEVPSVRRVRDPCG